MPDESEPTDPALPAGLPPDEMFARAMQSVRMTHSGGAHGWEPPSIEETARLFPSYEVLSLLGRGGMGAVYQARQVSLDRLVAIKLLPLEVSVDKDFADRFRREARAMAKLNHPNIIAVYDFGQTAEGHLFIAMEYVEGANLHDIIHQVGLDPVQALAIVEQVCAALGYAHGKGVVHRDIKPANVMINTESHVKVADFGLARLIDNAAPDLGHTMTGTVMGTPDYMAPEQTRGMNVDHRADIYSLGVMFYEMLCREVPKGIFQTPSVRTGCDPRIDGIVIKAKQQAPDHRYQSTQDMKADVQAARTPLVVPLVAAAPLRKPPAIAKPARLLGPVPPLAAKSRVLLYVGAAVAACVLISLLIFFTRHRLTEQKSGTPHPSGAASASTQPIDLLALIDPERDAVRGTWKRDGSTLVSDETGDLQEGPARLQIPYRPPAEYDFRIVFTRLGGDNDISQILAASGRSFAWKMGGNRNSGFGFDLIDGKYAEAGNPTLVRRARCIETGRSYESIVKVRKNGFSAFLDGKMITEWKTDYDDISTRPLYALRDPTLLGIGSWASRIRFERIDLLKAPGGGTQEASIPAGATKDAPFVNTLGMKFVPVPITSGPSDGKRVLFSVWETRVQDYEFFATETKRPWNKAPNFQQGPTHPAVNIDWDSANAFCAWLTGRERTAGRIGATEAYRLPSDHEWSCAVGIGEREDASKLPDEKSGKIADVFPWGSAWPPPANAGNYAGEERLPAMAAEKQGEVLTGYRDGFVYTAPVGSFTANPLGLCDLGGNVLEWCADWAGADRTARVARGDSWGGSSRWYLRSAKRIHMPPNDAGGLNGFRCVLGPAPALAPSAPK